MEAIWSAVIALGVSAISIIGAWLTTRQKASLGLVEQLQSRLLRVEKAEEICQERCRELQDQNAMQARQIKDLEHTVLELRSRIKGPDVCYIVADLDGMIHDATDDVFEILGYRAVELKDQNIDILMPVDAKDRHKHGLEHAKKYGARPHGVVIVAEALHKLGGLVKVAVTLSQVEGSSSPELYSAEVRRLHRGE